MKLPFEIDLKNKVAVVTGGGGVLCSMFAEAIAKAGAKVAILDLREENAKAVAETIEKDGGSAIGLKANVLEKASLEEAKNIINEKDNYVLGTTLGNFQGSGVKGKIQLGSGWWFNDNIDGMTSQIKALGNLGALAAFVGMLTDSRSILSYPRHEYFRRILCNIIGTWVEDGEFSSDDDILKQIVQDICCNNAVKYFNM